MSTQSPPRKRTAGKELIWKPPAPEVEEALIGRIIKLSLEEDLGRGDVTSESIAPAKQILTGLVTVKQEAVIAGLDILVRVFKEVDNTVEVKKLFEDGDSVINTPMVIAQVSGPAQAILSAERTALNFLQHLSGVATMTNKFVQRTEASGIKILDTRKTIPGMRALDKHAVAAGGGTNHRFSLSEALLIKDNHLQLAGGIVNAVTAARRKHPELKIEVEAKSIKEVAEAVESKVDAIMLDNMTPDLVRRALPLIKDTCFVELSGGINLDNIDTYLIEGVDAISIGALTHSAPSIDISLEIES